MTSIARYAPLRSWLPGAGSMHHTTFTTWDWPAAYAAGQLLL
ncbi:MAG: hypothetical protein R2849_08405 [Thermomicrobiales bacterium]